jgi:D-alanyl-D-alanine carboxypeptidase
MKPQRPGVVSRTHGVTPSLAAMGTDRRRATTEDIPVARRRALPQRKRRTGPQLVALATLVLSLSGAALLLGPLRSWLPSPVAGLRDRPGADGRLLGHFPYPEAPASALVAIAPGLQLRADAAEALRAMRARAAAEGIDLAVLSAFRGIALQRQLFFDVGAERNQSASTRAQVSAPPGYSEHSTGYAVDLGDGREPTTNLSPRFETTRAYAWLVANAARFHYQLSFPQDNRQGVSFEPWHWRYEGSTEALRTFSAAHRLGR